MAAEPEVSPSRQPESTKRRAACDECRTKKLKCTGEYPQCSRCARESITCIYSPQKQMGRPKKRSRSEDEPLPTTNKNGRHASPALRHKERAVDLQGAQNDAYNIAPYETPGGSLPPWLQDGADWNNEHAVPGDGSFQSRGESESDVPGLTPDNSSSRSPPLLNLPPELQANQYNALAYDSPSHRDGSTSLLLDPALAAPSCPSAHMPDCACLGTMYLTLNTLQGMDANLTFPYALQPLREAMQTASAVLSCAECPKRFITAVQNVQLVGTLLLSIAERFSKILEHITAEAKRASHASERKSFRLADLSTSYPHTGGIGCAAGFSLDLSAAEWSEMCKKVVRAEVHGPKSGKDCCCYFVGILRQMEERQDHWHRQPVPGDFPRNGDGAPIRGPKEPAGDEDDARHSRLRALVNQEEVVLGEDEESGKRRHEEDAGLDAEPSKEKADHLCLKMVNFARILVDAYDWS